MTDGLEADIDMVMMVLDELVEDAFHIVRYTKPSISDNWRYGYGDKNGAEGLTLEIEIRKPTRDQIKKTIREVLNGFHQRDPLHD